MNNKKGFTLVELLAVIVILAIILVIAVPQIINTIKDTTKASFESSAKMVASQVENQYAVAKTLGKEFGDTGNCMQEWAGLNNTDYALCTYEITNNGEAKVTLTGKGKFNGLSVCFGTRSSATATEETCPTAFEVNDWATIVRNVQSGSHPYFVGNEKIIDLGSLGKHTIRVANTTPCSEVNVESKTACGFVLEFADIITTHNMNGTDTTTATNAGGWPASEIYKYLNEVDENDDDDGVIYNALPEELRNGIIGTYVVSSHGGNNDAGTLTNGNYGSIDKLYLLSSQEVYGTLLEDSYDSSSETSRQLDYYEDNEVSTSNYSGAIKNNSSGKASSWWFRSAASNMDNNFYHVNTVGDWNRNSTHYRCGVSPAFRLAD